MTHMERAEGTTVNHLRQYDRIAWCGLGRVDTDEIIERVTCRACLREREQHLRVQLRAVLEQLDALGKPR